MDKSHRIQDYQALAAENQKLAQENAKLKEKKEKFMRPRPPMSREIIINRVKDFIGSPFVVVTLILCGVIGGFGCLIAWIDHLNNLDSAEQSKPADCYMVSQDLNDLTHEAWDSYYIYRVNYGRNQSWHKKTFPPGAITQTTSDGLRAVLVANQLKECK